MEWSAAERLSVRTILSPQGDLSCCYTYVFLIKDKRGRHYGRRFPKYTYTKSGTYYFSKTVPRDLKPHYTRNRIIICLKAKLAKKAELSSKSLLSKLENYWLDLRLTHTAVR